MRVLITGLTGLIGQQLAEALQSRGDDVWGLSRAERPDGNIRRWDPAAAALDPALVSGFDAVVHLAGENIGVGRWTKAKKERILHSRVHGTRLLSEALVHADPPPRVFVVQSAVGYYGHRAATWLTEDTKSGSGFLAEVVRAWEDAAQPARDADITVIHTRSGVVLSTRGGALGQMLLPFRAGLGGVIGEGDQFMSWISIDDMIRALVHLVDKPGESGAINVTSPNPVTNREFTKTLGAVLHRPTFFRVPAFAARIAFGEVANEALLGSQRVSADRLMAQGFAFRFPDLRPALEALIASGR